MKLKIFITISFALLLASVFTLTACNQAQAAETAGVSVQFENAPLPMFEEGDILPCDTASRWIKIDNTSGLTQSISVEAINFTNLGPTEDLSRILTIVIKQGATELYGGSDNPKTLYDFYQAGGVILSNAGAGLTQYDVIISFPCDKENEWQEKTTGFDLKVSAAGAGGEDDPLVFISTYSGGGGGSGLFIPPANETGAPDLTIKKTIKVSSANPGDSQIAYNILITNEGSATAFNVMLEDSLPPGFFYSGTTETKKIWPLGNIAPEDFVSLDYAVDIANLVKTGQYINTAVVSADNNEPRQASASLDITEPRVLGEKILGTELTGTGLDRGELVGMLAFLSILIMAIAVLRKKMPNSIN